MLTKPLINVPPHGDSAMAERRRRRRESQDPYRRFFKPQPDRPLESFMEFNLPDEERSWLLHKLPLCPKHHLPPVLFRSCGSELRFMVACDADDCAYRTPHFLRSSEAIDHWKMVTLLTA